MSQFLNPILLEPVGRSGWGPFKKTVWRVITDIRYFSDLLGKEVLIPQGFLTDLASVPRFLLLSWFIAGDSGTWASVVHYYLCENPEELEQSIIDNVFYEAMGVNSFAIPEDQWKRWMMWAGVRSWQSVKGIFN